MDDERMRELEEELGKPSFLLLVNHYWETIKHKAQVMRFLLMVCWNLIKRGLMHDLSKFKREEAHRFSVTVPRLSETTYGSEEYEELRAFLDKALEHHYENNSHHPEYWGGGIEDMPLLDLIEMLCDWKAATLRHDDGSILRSIKVNADRFEYDARWAERFQEFVVDIGAARDHDD